MYFSLKDSIVAKRTVGIGLTALFSSRLWIKRLRNFYLKKKNLLPFLAVHVTLPTDLWGTCLFPFLRRLAGAFQTGRGYGWSAAAPPQWSPPCTSGRPRHIPPAPHSRCPSQFQPPPPPPRPSLLKYWKPVKKIYFHVCTGITLICRPNFQAITITASFKYILSFYLSHLHCFCSDNIFSR